ncbi:MAG: hypothetical protein WCI18_17220 [Pseudomonadota bacterium]
MKSLIVLAALFCNQLTYSAEFVSIGGKSYSVSLQEFSPKICPQDGPTGPEWKAVKFLTSSTFDLTYNLLVAKCQTDCNQDQTCKQVCVSDNATVQKNKGRAMKAVFKFFRDFPPARQSTHCSAVRSEICEQKCVNEGTFDANSCLIGCNQYYGMFD